MDMERYHQTTLRVAELVDKEKNYTEALQQLQTLIDSDLPDLDKAMMSINMAVVCDLMGHESHALAWYDHGIALEQPLMRDHVTQRKAAYLVAKGRKEEAAAVYEKLLNEPFLTLHDKAQIQQNLLAVRG